MDHGSIQVSQVAKTAVSKALFGTAVFLSFKKINPIAIAVIKIDSM